MRLTKPTIFILGLLIGYELKDVKRALPFVVEVYNNIKAIATGEFIAELVVPEDDDFEEVEQDGDDE